MAQQQEHFLYLGRNVAVASHLHQVLVEVLRDQAQAAWPGAQLDAYPSLPYTNGGSNGHGPARQPARSHQPADASGGADAAPDQRPLPQLPLEIEIVSNQKVALRFVQNHATRLVAVETGTRAASRRRFCESLRQRAPMARIVAIGHAAQQVAPYDFAFDAVLPTPLRLDDLMRVVALVRTHSPEPILRCGPITLNTLTRKVISPKGEHEMTPKQCALLTLLMSNAGRVVPRAEIMQAIWDTNFLEDTRTLDVHMRWLRMLIEPDPAQPTLLVTKRGVGYQFVPGDGQQAACPAT